MPRQHPAPPKPPQRIRSSEDLARLRPRLPVLQALSPDDLPTSGYVPVAKSSVPLPFRTGELIAGKYEVIRVIGDGGMGVVVSAMHIELHELVALKFLRPEAMANPEIVARFAREARASVRIKSEYVARVFDVGNLVDGTPFIVMEHLEGEDLSHVLHAEGKLAVKVAVEYLMQACEALAAAHSIGVIHRDVKPENLFLTRRAQGMDIIKVLDFGISKVALTGSAFATNLPPMVRTSMPMGSPVYMSPEQIRASPDIDARTDIWSLGCVLYELLSGKPAFDAPSLTQLSATILEEHPAPLCTLVPETPPELEAVVQRCLEKHPKDRFQTVAEFAVALYPFAPRRARISAERCTYMLKGKEEELLSVAPPSLASAITTITTRPPMGNARTSSPASITIQEEPYPAPPSAKWKVLAFACAGLVLVASGYAALLHSQKPALTDLGAGPAEPAAVAAEHVLGAAPAALAARPARPALTAPENPERTATRANTGESAAASANAPAKRKTVVPQRSKRSVARPASKRSDEPDVGF